jgi:D-sedoheptulose 7-phosphate isomerase
MIKKHILKYCLVLENAIKALPVKKLEIMVNLILDAYKKEKQIFVFGNGGSGATASHFACDMNKCASYGRKKKFKVICLNDNVPVILAYANDLSYSDIFIEQLKNFIKPDDLIIGISGSGNSENVLRGIRYGNKNRARTIGLSGFDGGKLAKIAQFNFIAPVNDMQKVEDVHLIISHVIMHTINNLLKK